VTHVLLVGAWPKLIDQLVGLPARVSLLQLPGAATERASIPFRQVTVDYRDVDAAIDAAEQIHAVDPITVVVGLREFGLRATAAIARRLGTHCVPGPVESLDRDKAQVRAALEAGGCRAVRYAVCDSAAQLEGFRRAVGAPVVVKPRNGAGSVGVYAVTASEDVADGYRHAATASGSSTVLAEELLEGPEFSVETFSVAGSHEIVAVTRKTTTGAPHFLETGHVTPAVLATDVKTGLAAQVSRALTAIGHRDGPSHVEVIYTAAGPAIVEINRRIGGDRIWELLMLALDRDLMTETLRTASGLSRPSYENAARTAAIRYLIATGDAKLPDPPSPDLLADIPGLVRLELANEHAGSRPATSPFERVGYVLAVARTEADAVHAVDAAHDRVAQYLSETASS
jgi:biotin carboxylase